MVRKRHLRKSTETAAVLTDVWMSVQTRGAENHFNNNPGDSSEFHLSTWKHRHVNHFQGPIASLGLHSTFDRIQFYWNMDYSLYREVVSRKGEMGGPRERIRSTVTSDSWSPFYKSSNRLPSSSPTEGNLQGKKKNARTATQSVSALYWSC